MSININVGGPQQFPGQFGGPQLGGQFGGPGQFPGQFGGPRGPMTPQRMMRKMMRMMNRMMQQMGMGGQQPGQCGGGCPCCGGGPRPGFGAPGININLGARVGGFGF